MLYHFNVVGSSSTILSTFYKSVTRCVIIYSVMIVIKCENVDKYSTLLETVDSNHKSVSLLGLSTGFVLKIESVEFPEFLIPVKFEDSWCTEGKHE